MAWRRDRAPLPGRQAPPIQWAEAFCVTQSTAPLREAVLDSAVEVGRSSQAWDDDTGILPLPGPRRWKASVSSTTLQPYQQNAS